MFKMRSKRACTSKPARPHSRSEKMGPRSESRTSPHRHFGTDPPRGGLCSTPAELDRKLEGRHNDALPTCLRRSGGSRPTPDSSFLAGARGGQRGGPRAADAGGKTDGAPQRNLLGGAWNPVGTCFSAAESELISDSSSREPGIRAAKGGSIPTRPLSIS